MQLILSAFILSVSSNLDTVAVAISYGMQKIEIPILSNIIISLITSLGTLISMRLGVLLIEILPENLSNLLGGILLIFIGIWFLIDYIRKIKKNENIIIDENCLMDADKSGDISVKETIPLSLALTVNNLGVGLAASIAGVSVLYSVIFTFIITILSILCGTWIGNSILGKIFGKYAPIFSSILLIILGLYQSFI